MYDVRSSQARLTGEDTLLPESVFSAGDDEIPGPFGGALCEVLGEVFVLSVDCQ